MWSTLNKRRGRYKACSIWRFGDAVGIISAKNSETIISSCCWEAQWNVAEGRWALDLEWGMMNGTKWWPVKVTVSAKNVDQWSDQLVPAVVHMVGEETRNSAHEQQFHTYCWQRFIKWASCKCKKTLQEWITALQMDVTEKSGKICVLKVFIMWKFWSIHRNITENSGLPGCDTALLGRWSLAAFFMDLEPFQMKATNSFEMSGPTYQATRHHIP